MSKRIFLSFLPVLAIAIGVQAALLRVITESKPDQVVKLAPGVYFRHGDLKGKGHCNNGFILFKDFVLVIDSNHPNGAEACLADIKKLTDKPVRLVFDTHHHGDHAYGNPVWIAHGAIPIAHENVVTEMAKYEPKRWKESEAARDDIKKLGLDTAVPPIMTYPDRMVIDDGSQRVELLYFGTAHTPGDGFAYLPKHKILFTGDAVVNGAFNYMGDGDSHSWIKVIDSLEKLDVEVIAPGHGAVDDIRLLAKQKAFFLALHDAVGRGIKAGKSLEELQNSIKLPESVQKFVGDGIQAQIAKVYSEKNSN